MLSKLAAVRSKRVHGAFHAFQRRGQLVGRLAVEDAFDVLDDLLHTFDQVGRLALKRFNLFLDLGGDVVLDVVNQGVPRHGQFLRVALLDSDGLGAKEVGAVDHGHRIFGEGQVRVADRKLHKQVTTPVGHEFDASNLSNLKSIDETQGFPWPSPTRCRRPRRSSWTATRVEPLEVVHPEDEKDNARHGKHPHFEF